MGCFAASGSGGARVPGSGVRVGVPAGVRGGRGEMNPAGRSGRVGLRMQGWRTHGRHEKEASLHKNREGGSAHEGECGEFRAISV